MASYPSGLTQSLAVKQSVQSYVRAVRMAHGDFPHQYACPLLDYLFEEPSRTFGELYYHLKVH